MKLKPLIPQVFLIILLCWAPCWATDRFIRNDGSSTTNCTGLADAAYDGSGTGEACAHASPADAITAAACGDVIRAKAGHTFDGSWTLPNKSCTLGTEITITSTAALPNSRICSTGTAISDTCSNSANMPRFRTLGGGNYGEIFATATNAGYWILDGLELTDNATSTAVVNHLLDFGLANAGAHHMLVDRCWIHQKETGVTYNRYTQRAARFEGSNLSLKRSYVYLIGYYPTGSVPGDDFYQMDTTSVMSVAGPGPLTLYDNFISVWWNGFFLGGSDTAPAHTATLTGSSTTSATFSVTPPPAGTVVRFSTVGTATKSGGAVLAPNLTRLTGPVLTSADNATGLAAGSTMLITSVADPSKFGLAFLKTVVGDVWTFNDGTSGMLTIPDGEVTWEFYQTARMDSVVGFVGNYTPYGIDQLRHAPSIAAWCVGDEGLVVDVMIQRNTFNISIPFALDVYTHKSYGPKGWFEDKNSKRLTVDGNYWIGLPVRLVVYSQNQNGTAPWITTDQTTITNNWFAPDAGYTIFVSSAIILNSGSYLHTVTPNTISEISNNVVLNMRSLLQVEGADNVHAAHNTILNDEGTGSGYNSLVAGVAAPNSNWLFEDNIGNYVLYGFQNVQAGTLAEMWPTSVWRNNVIADLNAQSFATNQWGTGSILSPIPTTFAAINFVNLTQCRAGVIASCALAAASDYKGDGHDGSDPGVNVGTLAAALGPQGAASTSISGKVVVTGKVTAQD